MISDFALPTLLVAIKFTIRAVVNKEFKPVELVRSGLLLPADISFLAFTFCSVAAVNNQKSGYQIHDLKSFMFTVGIIFLLSIITPVTGKASEAAFDGKDNLLCAAIFIPSLFVSLVCIIFSTYIVGVI
jgi:hypothetical protein